MQTITGMSTIPTLLKHMLGKLVKTPKWVLYGKWRTHVPPLIHIVLYKNNIFRFLAGQIITFEHFVNRSRLNIHPFTLEYGLSILTVEVSEVYEGETMGYTELKVTLIAN